MVGRCHPGVVGGGVGDGRVVADGRVVVVGGRGHGGVGLRRRGGDVRWVVVRVKQINGASGSAQASRKKKVN